MDGKVKELLQIFDIFFRLKIAHNDGGVNIILLELHKYLW